MTHLRLIEVSNSNQVLLYDILPYNYYLKFSLITTRQIVDPFIYGGNLGIDEFLSISFLFLPYFLTYWGVVLRGNVL